MFNEIMNVFRRSVAAFRDELVTREPEDQVAELLASMRKELVAARAALPGYEEVLAHARTELGKEREALAQCERRGAMAERIGDSETTRIAREFAVRHQERVLVLEQKVKAAEAELDFARREADEMKLRYREADANRFALLAELRRSGARERMKGATNDGAFADWSRMEEEVERGAAYADALDELAESPRATSSPDPASVEERLKELKRRLGRED